MDSEQGGGEGQRRQQQQPPCCTVFKSRAGSDIRAMHDRRETEEIAAAASTIQLQYARGMNFKMRKRKGMKRRAAIDGEDDAHHPTIHHLSPIQQASKQTSQADAGIPAATTSSDNVPASWPGRVLGGLAGCLAAGHRSSAACASSIDGHEGRRSSRGARAQEGPVIVTSRRQ